MKLFGKNPDAETIIVAEIGINHEGDAEVASRLLSMAAKAGADAVKFQSFTPERYASASNPERLKTVSKFALDQETHERLATEAAELGVAIFSTPLSEDMVPVLDKLFPAIKIASGDLTFEAVIRAAAATGKPVLLSTGLGTMDEIERAIGWVRSEVGDAVLRDRLILMHCVSSYPTPMEEANVMSVPFLAEKTGLRVGYSNHVIGPEACYAAVALGACIVEVHFTDKKEGRAFRDHALSCDPADLCNLVAVLPRIRQAVGVRDKLRNPSEQPNLHVIRKGVVASRDLGAGSVLSASDLMYARPETEFPASEAPSLVGRTLTKTLRIGELIPRNGVA